MATTTRFAVASITALLVVGVFAVTIPGGDSPSDPAPAAETQATTPSAELAAEKPDSTESSDGPAQPEGAAQAEAVVAAVVSATATVAASEAEAPELLADLVSPSILNEIESNAFDLRRSGLRQTGSARISWLEASDPQTGNEDSTTVSVLACIDMSGVAFVTEAGEPAGVVNGLSSPRVLQQYTLAQEASGWVVTGLDFPNENAC